MLRVANRLNASPKVKKALISAGLVESNLRNLNYGDRDSLGVLQQRPSQGWGSPRQVRDIEYATRQFVKRAKPLRKKYGSAGELAQAVQRSAFPERYGQRGAEAEAIIRALSGSRSGASGGRSGGRGARTEVRTSTRTIPGEDRSEQRKALLLDYLDQRGRPDALLNLATGLKGAQDIPSRTVTKRERVRVRGSRSTSTRSRSKSSVLKPRGNWGGTSRPMASISRAVQRGAGVRTTSAKRTATFGNPGSDHHVSNTNASARDWGGSEAQRRKAVRIINRILGTKHKFGGPDTNVTIDGIRYQIISRPHGTGPHVHLGAKRVR